MESRRASPSLQFTTGLCKKLYSLCKEVTLMSVFHTKHLPILKASQVQAVLQKTGYHASDLLCNETLTEDMYVKMNLISNEKSSDHMSFMIGDKSENIIYLRAYIHKMADDINNFLRESKTCKIEGKQAIDSVKGALKITEVPENSEEDKIFHKILNSNALGNDARDSLVLQEHYRKPIKTSHGIVTYPSVSSPKYCPKKALHMINSMENKNRIRESQRRQQITLTKDATQSSNKHLLVVTPEDPVARYILYRLALEGAPPHTMDHSIKHIFLNYKNKLHIVENTVPHEDHRLFFDHFRRSMGSQKAELKTFSYNDKPMFECYAHAAMLFSLAHGNQPMEPLDRVIAASSIARQGINCVKSCVSSMNPSSRADLLDNVVTAHGLSLLKDCRQVLEDEIHSGAIVFPATVGGDKAEDAEYRRYVEEFEETEDDNDATMRNKQARLAPPDLLANDDDIYADVPDINNDVVEGVRMQKELSVMKEKKEEFGHSMEKKFSQYQKLESQLQDVKDRMTKLEKESDIYTEQGLKIRKDKLYEEQEKVRNQLDATRIELNSIKRKYDLVVKQSESLWKKFSRISSEYKSKIQKTFNKVFFYPSQFVPRSAAIANAMINLMQYYFSFGDTFFDQVRTQLLNAGFSDAKAANEAIESVPELKMFMTNMVKLSKVTKWPEIPGGYVYEPPIHPIDSNGTRYDTLYRLSELLRAFLLAALDYEPVNVNAAFGKIGYGNNSNRGVPDVKKWKDLYSFFVWIEGEITCTSKGLSLNASKHIQARRDSNFCHMSGGTYAHNIPSSISHTEETYTATVFGRAMLNIEPHSGDLICQVPGGFMHLKASDEMKREVANITKYNNTMNDIKDELFSEYLSVVPKEGSYAVLSLSRFIDWYKMNTYLLQHRLFTSGWRKELLEEHKILLNNIICDTPWLRNNEDILSRLHLVYPNSSRRLPSPREIAWAKVASSLYGGSKGQDKTNQSLPSYPQHTMHVIKNSEGWIATPDGEVLHNNKGVVDDVDDSVTRVRYDASNDVNLTMLADMLLSPVASGGSIDRFLKEKLNFQKLESKLNQFVINSGVIDALNIIPQTVIDFISLYNYPPQYDSGKPDVSEQSKKPIIQAIDGINEITDSIERTTKDVLNRTSESTKKALNVVNDTLIQKLDDSTITTTTPTNTDYDIREFTDLSISKASLDLIDVFGIGVFEENAPSPLDATAIMVDVDPNVKDFMQNNFSVFNKKINNNRANGTTKLTFEKMRTMIRNYCVKWELNIEDFMVVLTPDSLIEELGVEERIKNNENLESFYLESHMFIRGLEVFPNTMISLSYTLLNTDKSVIEKDIKELKVRLELPESLLIFAVDLDTKIKSIVYFQDKVESFVKYSKIEIPDEYRRFFVED